MLFARSFIVAVLLFSYTTREAPAETPDLAPPFRWKCGPPVQAPEVRPSDRCFSVKDPTIVRYRDRWHLFTTIRSGVPGTQMPSFSALPSDDVWRLVTYIKSLSGQGGSLGVATGNAQNGERLFFAKGGCTTCHGRRGADRRLHAQRRLDPRQ